MKALFLTTALVSGLFIAQAKADDFSKADIENIIKEYIQKNPEVILDSVEEYGRGQQEAELEERQQSIQEHMGWLENNEILPVAGNPNGDVTIVEFFDYNCGYCKKAVDDVMTLMSEDKNIKFIFVETPILGRTSELAAKWAMAAKNQKAYLEFHSALMHNRGPINESSLETIAKTLKLDIEKLKADADSEIIAKQVAEKSEKASQMGISGTPAFIIDGKLYGGYIGLDKMRKAVADARQGKAK